MPDPSIMPVEERTPWAWLSFGLLLGFCAYFSVSQGLRISFAPHYLLSLLAAWLGGRYGWKALKVVLTIFLVSVFSPSWSVTDQVSVAFGYDSGVCLLSIFVCIAFARSRDSTTNSCSHDLCQPWWRFALWLAITALALGILASTADVLERRVPLGIRIGSIIFLLILLAAVRWPRVLRMLRARRLTASALAAAVVVVIALNVDAKIELSDTTVLYVGQFFPSRWLLVVCFIVAVWRLVDWRALVALLFGTFCIGVMVRGQFLDTWNSLRLGLFTDQRLASDVPVEVATAWNLLIGYIGAVLLGRVLQPFWHGHDVQSLRTWRTPVLLGGVLVLQFVSMPAYYEQDTLLLAGVAFAVGLTWREKGLIAFPCIVLLCTMISLILSHEHDTSVDLGNIALMFPFAFFGYLANRYDTPVGWFLRAQRPERSNAGVAP